MKITFVCTGNTCRSPMAEGIARTIAKERYPDRGFTFASAGLNTFNGSPASQNAIDVCREAGIDLASHRSQRLNPEIAANTDLFAVMTPHHAAFLRQCGIPKEKIAVLGGGIPDPFGGDIETYRACRDAIADAVEALLASVTAGDTRKKEQPETEEQKEITVVPMTAGHIPQIARIEEACFSTPWSEKALEEELSVPTAAFLTALAGNDVAGYMGMQVAGGVGYVCNVAVAPDYRRQGIASALILAQIDYARAHSLSEITLEVRTSNTAARALYEKCGFTRLGTRPRFYREPTEDAEIYSYYL